MTWLWIILIVAAIGGLIGFLGSGKSEDAVAGAAGAGIGCGYLMLQIFLTVLGFWLLFKIATFLFS